MKVKNLFHLMTIIFLTFSACSRNNDVEEVDNGLKIRLTADSSSVELYHIPLQVIDELRSESLQYEQWQNFFAVYEETADPDMRDFQPALSGSYALQDSMVVFKPDTVFQKGTAYFSRCYTREILTEPENILSKRDLSPTEDFIEYRFVIR